MVEEDYIFRVASQVQNFKSLMANKFQFTCVEPTCGDNAKVRSSARGNFFIYQGEWMYHCYHCGASYHFKTFLKKFFPDLYEQFIFDNLGYSKKNRVKKEEPLKIGMKKPVFETLTALDELVSLEDNLNHPATKYLLGRGLTMDMVNELYYTDNFKKYINDFMIKDKFKNTDKPDPRVVIPFLDEDNKLLGVQGRALDPDAYARYFSIKIVPEEYQLVYGANKVDFTKDVFVVEGPIDAMFINNCLAWGGGSLHTIKTTCDPILVWDNEPDASAINQQIEKAIDMGFRIVVWNKRNKWKDINEMVNHGIDVSTEYLLANTYKGLEAKMMFNKWRRDK